MTGQRITYGKHCKVEFRTCIQAHEKHNNSLEPRTSGSVAHRPSGNEQGGHYFLSLHTGKRILRNNWMILPMPNDIVDAVHRLAAASKQAGCITLTDQDGNIITDDDKNTEEEAMEDEPIPIPKTSIENDQAITGEEENNVLEENEIEENDNLRPEPDSNTNKNNTQEEITGVTEEDNNDTVPILEE